MKAFLIRLIHFGVTGPELRRETSNPVDMTSGTIGKTSSMCTTSPFRRKCNELVLNFLNM